MGIFKIKNIKNIDKYRDLYKYSIKTSKDTIGKVWAWDIYPKVKAN